jgi:outer membrane biosynthesis protein TonB
MPSVPEELDDSDGASVFDLLIDQYGHVEQVRLVSPANRFRDRILVSAAKAWQFQPATRDGQPVRYRLRLRITP